MCVRCSSYGHLLAHRSASSSCHFFVADIYVPTSGNNVDKASGKGLYECELDILYLIRLSKQIQVTFVRELSSKLKESMI